MDTTVFNNAEVQQQLSEFVLLRIDVDRNNSLQRGPDNHAPSEVAGAPDEPRLGVVHLADDGNRPPDSKSAREAYAQARLIAAPDSPVDREATAALNENPDFF